MKDYKKILEGVVNIISTTEKSDIGFSNICAYIGENCPELKESEDERIRETLIRFHKSTIDVDGIKGEDIIAWLEKQEGCEHIKKEWTTSDAVTLKELIDFLENGTAKLQHDLTRYANWLKIQFTPIEKQGKKKIQ